MPKLKDIAHKKALKKELNERQKEKDQASWLFN